MPTAKYYATGAGRWAAPCPITTAKEPMLSREKLAELYQELQDETVLTIYLDGRGDDPADRKMWRKELEHEIERSRSRMDGASNSERKEFDSALALLMKPIEAFDAFVPARGWVGIATPEKVWYTEAVPVPMPTLVRWEPGLRLAPYIRGLKQDRVVAAVLLDSQRARIFEYRDGELVEPEAIRADTFVGDLTDVNTSKRPATHSGTRGKTGTDAAQRILEVTTERMRKRILEIVSDMIGPRGLLVIGGTPEMVAAAARNVPKDLNGRVAERPSLHVEMPLPEVKDAVETAASELSRTLQAKLVGRVVDQARAQGLGCLGREDTEQALREGRVDTLILARSFIEEDQDFADRCVGTAFGQQAEVEEVSGEADERLSAEGGGIGARLRYRIEAAAGAEEAASEGAG